MSFPYLGHLGFIYFDSRAGKQVAHKINQVTRGNAHYQSVAFVCPLKKVKSQAALHRALFASHPSIKPVFNQGGRCQMSRVSRCEEGGTSWSPKPGGKWRVKILQMSAAFFVLGGLNGIKFEECSSYQRAKVR